LPNAVLFAEKGFETTIADLSERIVRLTNAGKSHIKDAVLEKSVPRAHATGRLKATTDVAAASAESDVIIISVPTPTKNNAPDLSFVEAASAAIGKGIAKSREEKLVVLESTVYPGVCRTVLKPILERESKRKCGRDFFLAHCPERINPGDDEHSIRRTPRVVGGLDERAGELAQALYESVVEARVFRVSDMDTAELVKLTENTQRDVNIAFINEIALVCERIGVDVREVIEACATKWNFYKVWPGPGVGGHCLPNNPYYIMKAAEEAGFKPKLMRLGREVNDEMMHHAVELVENALGEAGLKIKGTRIALFGVAYKPDVDDVRQAPSRPIAAELRAKGAALVITDPHVNEVNARKVHDKIVSTDEALRADCLVFLQAHSEYKKIPASKIKNAKAIVDMALLFDEKKLRAAGVKGVYRRVGKGKPAKE
jgi:nucleotide sugar dehydrogenase